MKISFQPLLLSLAGFFLGISIGLIFAYVAGENPMSILSILFKSAFGSRYDFGITLYYSTPLIFTGLAVAVAFHAGLFNIGAEGQLNLATLALAVAGVHFAWVPIWLAPFFSIFVAVFVGALWGWFPGWLKARRGGHEVINTIMLNFVSAALVSWLLTKFFQNPTSQNPETAQVLPAFRMRSWDPVARFFVDSPVSIAFLLAVAAAIILWIFLWRTRLGFEIRSVGGNEVAAKFAGVNVARTQQIAMALSGALAGMVAFGEILGNAERFRLGFSPEFGFLGIAVALLARNHPLGIIFSAFLFAALHKGAADLDIETEFVTRDLSLVIQASIIFSVAIFSALSMKRRK